MLLMLLVTMSPLIFTRKDTSITGLFVLRHFKCNLSFSFRLVRIDPELED